jgi:hypothetical protein
MGGLREKVEALAKEWERDALKSVIPRRNHAAELRAVAATPDAHPPRDAALEEAAKVCDEESAAYLREAEGASAEVAASCKRIALTCRRIAAKIRARPASPSSDTAGKEQ